MSAAPSTTGTVHLHRVLKAPPERVFRAFVEPAAMCRWLPPYGFTAEVHRMDARVGGLHRMSFTNFGTGHRESFGGEYLEVVPGERLRYTDRFDAPGLPGTMEVSVTFRAVACGTELTVVQSGIPAVIPTEMCYLGWQESLAQLARLVEPEIPNG
ncbi:MAG: SRPBCC family protein [Hydrogenophaga sp.]|uniref:SRPBCC family protein n=1 Tax=Hydrogenophaga sp. TaxID=1904254 RepID=UPI001D5A4B7D|nr:SRPBCC family protein [Hydrogenophaga sp.]MBX3609617.1 SRPBCC family protein [Hydrogenophaga sp.]